MDNVPRQRERSLTDPTLGKYSKLLPVDQTQTISADLKTCTSYLTFQDIAKSEPEPLCLSVPRSSSFEIVDGEQGNPNDFLGQVPFSTTPLSQRSFDDDEPARSSLFSSRLFIFFHMQTYTDILYHQINILFSVFSIAILAVGIGLGICFIPLCCCGIIVVKYTLKCVKYLAKIDVMIYNATSLKNKDHLVPSDVPPLNCYFGYRLCQALNYPYSVDTIMVFLYFTFFKVPLAVCCYVLSMGSILLSVRGILSIILSADDGPDSLLCISGTCIRKRESVSWWLLWIIWTFFAFNLNTVCAQACKDVTKFCCCEYFSTDLFEIRVTPGYYGQKGVKFR